MSVWRELTFLALCIGWEGGAHAFTSSVLTPLSTKRPSIQHPSASLLLMATTNQELDWSFVDGVYLITCPNADPGSMRLERSRNQLESIGLWDRVTVKEFDTDDEDRIRGCYTSHISVLKDSLRDLKPNSRNPIESLFNGIIPTSTTIESNKKILVLEDNLALTGSLTQSVIDSLADYANGEDDWDMIHLSYIPYVPNLVVSRTDKDNIVKLSTGIGSALGTTAYIISEAGIQAVLEQDARQGYYAPIPDVMAEIFPDTRVAAFPTPFVRAPKTKSLVNPQLDDLREVLFQPAFTSKVQAVLALTGLSTNALLPLTIIGLLFTSLLSGRVTLDAAVSLLTTGTYEGPIFFPLASCVFTLFSLTILAQGMALAPKPPQTAPIEEQTAITA